MTRRASLLRCAVTCFLVAAMALWLLFVTGCSSVVRHIDPPLYFAPNALQAWWEAEQVAELEIGDVYLVQPTGSMEPLLTGGDYICSAPRPFASYLVGNVITYRADWAPPPDPYVTHRVVGKDRYGLIMSGDANPYSESHWRVTDATDGGLVVGIWRVKPL